MKTNVKGLERLVRIVAGAGLIAGAANVELASAVNFGSVGGVVGVALLGTGVLASCPVKSVLGLGSKKAPARSTATRKPAKRKPARKAAAKKPAAKRKAAPKRRRAAR